MKNVHLLVIDPQMDFCKKGSSLRVPAGADAEMTKLVESANKSGALFVPGADEDMSRLAKFVNRVGDKLNSIHVTMDSHHPIDIAHPIFWKDQDGVQPDPFTIITNSDVKSGVWRAKRPSDQKRASEYVAALETNNRYSLCIWPPHCLIGDDGYKVVPELFSAFRAWEEKGFKVVNFVTKGSNPFTEHYSAVQADVLDPSDVTTHLNNDFIKTLQEADVILVAGEAGSHCLALTVSDISKNFADQSYIGKITLLEDATSPVQGCEQLQTDFIKEMTAKGMKVSTTVDWMATANV